MVNDMIELTDWKSGFAMRVRPEEITLLRDLPAEMTSRNPPKEMGQRTLLVIAGRHELVRETISGITGKITRLRESRELALTKGDAP